jgi:alkanesulfonate monooxygenase SsuD/methylene tetrahydromethanopterin reductase-like flavin-dependent oxidoreductase (luciferase family)
MQQPHPPIIVGGNGGPRGLALAARWADEYNSPNVLPEEAARRRGLLDGACEQVDREPIALSGMLGFLIGASDAEVEARTARMHEQFGTPPGDARLTLTGTPDEVIARLHEYAAAGVHRVVLGTLLHRNLEHIELLGNFVSREFAR